MLTSEQVLRSVQASILGCSGQEFEFEFSQYVPGGPGVTISRQIIRLGSARAVVALGPLVESLDDEAELALHSRIHPAARPADCLHIPMIDIQGGDLGPVERRVREECTELGTSATVLATGRGYHVYFHTALPADQWHRFLGRILLWTPPISNAAPVPVDARWVGHSLVQGFSALRLTKHTANYLQPPILACEVAP